MCVFFILSKFPRPTCTGRKGSENHPSAGLFVLQKEYGFSMMAGVCYSVNTEKSKLKYGKNRREKQLRTKTKTSTLVWLIGPFLVSLFPFEYSVCLKMFLCLKGPSKIEKSSQINLPQSTGVTSRPSCLLCGDKSITISIKLSSNYKY